MRTKQWIMSAGLLAGVALVLTGCPDGLPDDLLPPEESPEEAYDRGFDDGFMDDDEYWYGYFHGYDTMGTEILYDGHLIDYLDEYSYDAGYYDGLWYAYNDGYFVNYRDAFIIGWSEGYDRGYRSDYLEFLGWDVHDEYLHGGWIDGYNDGFSEGRIFGAYDYEQGLEFDWLDALFDYEEGVDLYFEEVNLGTGVDGPVILYEWGENPHELVKDEDQKAADTPRERMERAGRTPPAIRADAESKAAMKVGEMYRPLTNEVESELGVQPEESMRTDDPIEHLNDTWLDRVNRYRQATKSRLQTEEEETTEP